MNSRRNALTTSGNSHMEVRSPKNRVLAILFCVFFGVFGVHRFYAGKFWSGIFQFFTAGGFGVWWLVDLVLLLMGRFKDGEGRVMGPPQHAGQRRLPSKRQRQTRPPERRQEANEGPRGTDGEVEFDDDDLLADPLEKEFEKLEQEQQKSRG